MASDRGEVKWVVRRTLAAVSERALTPPDTGLWWQVRGCGGTDAPLHLSSDNMAAASPKTSAEVTPSSPPVLPVRPREPASEPWIEPVRWGALVVFVAVPIFSLLVQSLAGRVVWTIVVAALPLFIVLVGYHRWRRICPLAFFSQLPVLLKHAGRLKASPWLEANYYYVTFAIFVFSLWLRLIATNGDGRAIAVFFVLLSLAALTFGLLYTGKTWCNHICPVSFVEKIYTEPRGLRETVNSQCVKCTACKKHCPDINEENAYWKEIGSRPKRFVYFAFPGVVFAFYCYYYLQAGTWDYYFRSIEIDQHRLQWVDQPGLILHAFFPGGSRETAGFFFLPDVPRALAAILTLGVGVLLGFLSFSLLEKLIASWLRRRASERDERQARHLALTMASFTAFVTFYTFAGAPTLMKISWLPHFFGIIVVLTATLCLIRRYGRTQKVFGEEALARNIIKRWQWADELPPKDLREAFLIHTIRSRETARSYDQILATYNDALRETLRNGYITRKEAQLLESLRNQLQIKPVDHEKIMNALADEERVRISDPSAQISAEKRLQLETYARALEAYLARATAADEAPDDSFVRQLRAEYRVTRSEHAAVLEELLDAAGGLGKRLAQEVAIIEQAAQTMQALELEPSPAHDFLRDLLRRRRMRAIDHLIRGMGFASTDEMMRVVRDGLSSADGTLRRGALDQLRAAVSSSAAERLLAVYGPAAEDKAPEVTLTGRLRALLDWVDGYVRAAALYSLGERGAVDGETLSRLSEDEHEIVRETARCLTERGEQQGHEARTPNRLTIIEKMIALRSAPIFSTLEPLDLAALARSSVEVDYAPGAALCLEGTQGKEAFILLRGEVEVLRSEGWSGKEQSGSLIGEMAVLDPAPRAATVLAGASGARVLRLDGSAFRDAVNVNPAIAAGVIRALARRLRGAQEL